jgi:hypothetical protein
MCCFSRPVKFVADTNIFARSSKGGRQFLVYSMKLNSAEELAMILPIPTPKGAADDAVRFISLAEYPKFFDDLRAGFPEPPPPRAEGRATLGGAKSAPLPVVTVGSFIASFVPSVRDFVRLDDQFRLPTEVWDHLPLYKDYGFAVFKLKKGEQKIHPMAFEFPRADPRRLFFPTVHIHDGKVHATANFDHALFCQIPEASVALGWTESPQIAREFMKLDKAAGLIDGDGHVYKKTLRGRLKNADVLV